MRTTILVTAVVLASLICQSIPANAQLPLASSDIRVVAGVDVFAEMSERSLAGDLDTLLEKLFGTDANEAATSLRESGEDLLRTVTSAASGRTEEILNNEISERGQRKRSAPVIEPEIKKTPANRRPRRTGFVGTPWRFDWRQVAFGFQPIASQDEKPEVKMTETDKEIKAEGTDKKVFETRDAKGTRTQKAQTRYIKDGKTFGVEIKQLTVIEAVSKPEGKAFRQELSIAWGAEVAACPDVEGITAGTGKAKVVSKTTYSENGETFSIIHDFDIQATLKGLVNDQAQLKYYDLQADAYFTSSGGEDAQRRNLVKQLKVKDGRYGIHYDIPGNTIEMSDGTYGGKRTPAKMGKVGGHFTTPMSASDQKTVADAIGPMVPSIWNSANDMYRSAERNWKNYGCVEVRSRVPKTVLEPGEQVEISTETVHLQDNSKVNAELKAEAYQADITPEEQSGRPVAQFTLTQLGEGDSTFSVQSISKRGIGKGDVEFQLKKEKESASGIWTGTIRAERNQREEREKRSGANLEENGGHLVTTTDVQLAIDGRLDRTVDATNAYIARVSGVQEAVDFEYDRYKIDEGYCGPNAVPYKGPKEITRTSTTTASYQKETRAYLELGDSGGTITFSLPETAGTTVHRYVHKSPCAEHDRVNTNQATDEGTPTAGGSFSFSFPIRAGEKTIKGSITIRGEDGSTTTYTWELSRE